MALVKLHLEKIAATERTHAVLPDQNPDKTAGKEPAAKGQPAEELKQNPPEWMPWNYRETLARLGRLRLRK